MSKLTNKVALVTGASKGIGAAIAKHLAAQGATVVVNYSSSKAGAEKTVAQIEAAGGAAVAIQGDFAKAEDIKRTYAEIESRYKKLDVLVNNAGVYSFGAIEQITPDEFHRQFNLNVLGLLLSTQAALPLFPAEGGSIINIGSVVGSMPPPHSSIYSATKAAVNNITITHSKELGSRKIRVNALNPGLVATEGTQAMGALEGGFHDTAVKTTPLGRIGQPDDIGSIAAFLASDDSYWLTGQTLLAGGGTTW